MKPLDPTRHHADRCQSEHAAWAPDGTLIVAIGVGEPPARAKFTPGDWVVIHGRPRAAPGHRRYGMRGVVLGGCGGGYYYGLTDDGRQWVERGGELLPDGTADPDGCCTCCPTQPMKAGRATVEVQLDLFSPEVLFATRPRIAA